MFLHESQTTFVPWSFQIQDGSTVAGRDTLSYDNSQFDTYEDCLAAARAQTTCSMPKDAEYQFYAFSTPQHRVCKTSIQCSSLNEKVYYTSVDVFLNQTHLVNPAFGKCNNQANVSTCSNINSNCEILKRFRSSYEDILRKNLLTPELICRPFYEFMRAVPVRTLDSNKRIEKVEA